jgi:hypothetical protein
MGIPAVIALWRFIALVAGLTLFATFARSAWKTARLLECASILFLTKKTTLKTYLKFVSRYLAAVFMRGEYKLSRTK